MIYYLFHHYIRSGSKGKGIEIGSCFRSLVYCVKRIDNQISFTKTLVRKMQMSIIQFRGIRDLFLENRIGSIIQCISCNSGETCIDINT